MPTRSPAEHSGTETAGRVADVLLLFADGDQYLGVTAISRALGLSKAVVYRILQSLVSRELLATDPGVSGYRLGPAAVALGATAMRRFDARVAAEPVLRKLRDATGETTTLSGLVGDERVYLQQFESPREIKMTVDIGRRSPCTRVLRQGRPGLSPGGTAGGHSGRRTPRAHRAHRHLT